MGAGDIKPLAEAGDIAASVGEDESTEGIGIGVADGCEMDESKLGRFFD